MIDHSIIKGLHRWPSSIATRPHPSHTYFMASSLSVHMCVVSMLKIPQKLQLDLSPQGLHKCPGSFATAPQLLQVYDMVLLLLYGIIIGRHPIRFLCFHWIILYGFQYLEILNVSLILYEIK